PVPPPELAAPPERVERTPAARTPSDADEWTQLPTPRSTASPKKDRRGSRLPWKRHKGEPSPDMDGHRPAPSGFDPAPAMAAASTVEPAPTPRKVEIACPRCGQPSPRGLC